jgi:hypothetical protein
VPAREGKEGTALDEVLGRVQAQRVQDRRHDVDRLGETRLGAAARAVGLRRRIVEQEGHALDAVVEQLLLPEPVVTEVVAVVRAEHHQRVPPPAEPLHGFPHPAEVAVELRDQALVGRADGRHRLVAGEVHRHLLALELAQHGVRAGAALGFAAHHGQAVLGAEHRVVGRRGDVGPVRLHVGQVQHPGSVALMLHEADRHIGGVGRLAVLFPHAGREARVAHLPAGQRAVGAVHGDHVVGPGIGAVVALGPEPVGVGAVGLAVMAVVPVHQGEPPLLQQRLQVVVQNLPFSGYTGERKAPACEGWIATGRVSCAGGCAPPRGQACWG